MFSLSLLPEPNVYQCLHSKHRLSKKCDLATLSPQYR